MKTPVTCMLLVGAAVVVNMLMAGCDSEAAIDQGRLGRYVLVDLGTGVPGFVGATSNSTMSVTSGEIYLAEDAAYSVSFAVECKEFRNGDWLVIASPILAARGYYKVDGDSITLRFQSRPARWSGIFEGPDLSIDEVRWSRLSSEHLACDAGFQSNLVFTPEQ